MASSTPPIRLRFVLGIAAIGLAAACPMAMFAAGKNNAAEHQARLRLQEQPSDPGEVLDVRKRLLAAKSPGDAGQPREVVVTGRVGGMPNVWPETHPEFPWYRGQASFFLVDRGVAAQFAAHAKRHGGGYACAFCKALAAKNAHAIAVVNFVDDQGGIVRVDARQLLDLKEHQTVTIRGKAKLLAGSMLVIDADGVFVPR